VPLSSEVNVMTVNTNYKLTKNDVCSFFEINVAPKGTSFQILAENNFD